jgi:hypothetical protein
LNGEEITREIAEDLGYKSVRAYRNALLKAINDAESDLADVGKNLADIPLNAFKEMMNKDS